MPKFTPKKLATKKSVSSCVACQGEGISSTGGRCLPCNGTGKKLSPISTVPKKPKYVLDLSLINTVPKKPKYVLDIEKTTGLSCVFCDFRLGVSRWNVVSPTGFVLFTVSSTRDDIIGESTYPNLYDLTGSKHA